MNPATNSERGKVRLAALAIFTALIVALSIVTYGAIQQKTGILTLTVGAQVQIQEVGSNVLLKIRLAPGATAQVWADNACAQPKNNAMSFTASGTYTISEQTIKGQGEAFACVLSSDGKLQASTSLRTTQSPTTTSIVSSVNPSVFGQSVLFTATVADNSGGGGTPTGTVTFKDGGTALGTGTLNASRVATYATSSLAAAAHTITAAYAGDANFLASTSSGLTDTVNQSSSAAAVASSANPAVFGQPVTFTATLTASGGGTGTPSGTVTFKDGVTTFGTGVLNPAGVATYVTSALSVTAHTITVTYPGDTNFTASTSPALSETVNKSPTSSGVTCSVNPSAFGQSVTFTATITASGGAVGTATGTVTFKDGSTTFGTGTLNGSGIATYATGALSVAAHSITIVYAGDANFVTSTSATVTQTVNKAPTVTAVTSSANNPSAGQSVTFTATITASGGGAGTATGTVTFKDGSTTLGAGTLNGSEVATLATTSLTSGTHSITTVYAGDTKFLTSTSAALSQKVK